MSTSAAQPGRERFRWEEFLPVRGRWARRLLRGFTVCLVGLFLWAAAGLNVEIGGYRLESQWTQWTYFLHPPDRWTTSVLVFGSSPQSQRWGWYSSLTQPVAGGWYLANLFVPLPAHEIRRRGLSPAAEHRAGDFAPPDSQ